MKFKTADLMIVLILAAPFAYLLLCYESLPDRIAIHWEANGKPNDWTEKSRSWLTLLFTSSLAFVSYLIFRFITILDPKKLAFLSAEIFHKIGFATVVFIASLNLMILYGSTSESMAFGKMGLILASLLLAFLGNLMYNLKPNYFFGIRTPWALEDETNWRLTHRLASKLWLGGGILSAILIFAFPQSAAFTIFISSILILVIIPIAYSFSIFKKTKVSQ